MTFRANSPYAWRCESLDIPEQSYLLSYISAALNNNNSNPTRNYQPQSRAFRMPYVRPTNRPFFPHPVRGRSWQRNTRSYAPRRKHHLDDIFCPNYDDADESTPLEQKSYPSNARPPVRVAVCRETVRSSQTLETKTGKLNFNKTSSENIGKNDSKNLATSRNIGQTLEDTGEKDNSNLVTSRNKELPSSKQNNNSSQLCSVSIEKKKNNPIKVQDETKQDSINAHEAQTNNKTYSGRTGTIENKNLVTAANKESSSSKENNSSQFCSISIEKKDNPMEIKDKKNQINKTCTVSKESICSVPKTSPSSEERPMNSKEHNLTGVTVTNSSDQRIGKCLDLSEKSASKGDRKNTNSKNQNENQTLEQNKSVLNAKDVKKVVDLTSQSKNNEPVNKEENTKTRLVDVEKPSKNCKSTPLTKEKGNQIENLKCAAKPKSQICPSKDLNQRNSVEGLTVDDIRVVDMDISNSPSEKMDARISEDATSSLTQNFEMKSKDNNFIVNNLNAESSEQENIISIKNSTDLCERNKKAFSSDSPICSNNFDATTINADFRLTEDVGSRNKNVTSKRILRRTKSLSNLSHGSFENSESTVIKAISTETLDSSLKTKNNSLNEFDDHGGITQIDVKTDQKRKRDHKEDRSKKIYRISLKKRSIANGSRNSGQIAKTDVGNAKRKNSCDEVKHSKKTKTADVPTSSNNSVSHQTRAQNSKYITKAEYVKAFAKKSPMPNISLSIDVPKAPKAGKVQRRRSTFTCEADNETILKKVDRSLKNKQKFLDLFGSESEDEEDPTQFSTKQSNESSSHNENNDNKIGDDAHVTKNIKTNGEKRHSDPKIPNNIKMNGEKSHSDPKIPNNIKTNGGKSHSDPKIPNNIKTNEEKKHSDPKTPNRVETIVGISSLNQPKEKSNINNIDIKIKNTSVLHNIKHNESQERIDNKENTKKNCTPDAKNNSSRSDEKMSDIKAELTKPNGQRSYSSQARTSTEMEVHTLTNEQDFCSKNNSKIKRSCENSKLTKEHIKSSQKLSSGILPSGQRSPLSSVSCHSENCGDVLSSYKNNKLTKKKNDVNPKIVNPNSSSEENLKIKPGKREIDKDSGEKNITTSSLKPGQKSQSFPVSTMKELGKGKKQNMSSENSVFTKEHIHSSLKLDQDILPTDQKSSSPRISTNTEMEIDGPSENYKRDKNKIIKRKDLEIFTTKGEENTKVVRCQKSDHIKNVSTEIEMKDLSLDSTVSDNSICRASVVQIDTPLHTCETLNVPRPPVVKITRITESEYLEKSYICEPIEINYHTIVIKTACLHQDDDVIAVQPDIPLIDLTEEKSDGYENVPKKSLDSLLIDDKSVDQKLKTHSQDQSTVTFYRCNESDNYQKDEVQAVSATIPSEVIFKNYQNNKGVINKEEKQQGFDKVSTNTSEPLSNLMDLFRLAGDSSESVYYLKKMSDIESNSKIPVVGNASTNKSLEVDNQLAVSSILNIVQDCHPQSPKISSEELGSNNVKSSISSNNLVDVSIKFSSTPKQTNISYNEQNRKQYPYKALSDCRPVKPSSTFIPPLMKNMNQKSQPQTSIINSEKNIHSSSSIPKRCPDVRNITSQSTISTLEKNTNCMDYSTDQYLLPKIDQLLNRQFTENTQNVDIVPSHINRLTQFCLPTDQNTYNSNSEVNTGPLLYPANEELSTLDQKLVAEIFTRHIYFLVHLRIAQNGYIEFLKKQGFYQGYFRSEISLFTQDIQNRFMKQSLKLVSELQFLNIRATRNNNYSVAKVMDQIVFNLAYKKTPHSSKSMVYLVVHNLISPHYSKLENNHFFVALLRQCQMVVDRLHTKYQDPFTPEQRQIFISQIKEYTKSLSRSFMRSSNRDLPTSYSERIPSSNGTFYINSGNTRLNHYSTHQKRLTNNGEENNPSLQSQMSNIHSALPSISMPPRLGADHNTPSVNIRTSSSNYSFTANYNHTKQTQFAVPMLPNHQHRFNVPKGVKTHRPVTNNNQNFVRPGGANTNSLGYTPRYLPTYEISKSSFVYAINQNLNCQNESRLSKSKHALSPNTATDNPNQNYNSALPKLPVTGSGQIFQQKTAPRSLNDDVMKADDSTSKYRNSNLLKELLTTSTIEPVFETTSTIEPVFDSRSNSLSDNLDSRPSLIKTGTPTSTVFTDPCSPCIIENKSKSNISQLKESSVVLNQGFAALSSIGPARTMLSPTVLYQTNSKDTSYTVEAGCDNKNIKESSEKTGSEKMDLKRIKESDNESSSEIRSGQNTSNTETPNVYEMTPGRGQSSSSVRKITDSISTETQNKEPQISDGRISDLEMVSPVQDIQSSSNEIETIDLTWIDDVDNQELQEEMDFVFIKNEELDTEINFNEPNRLVASSPADSGISSPLTQTEEHTVVNIVNVESLCFCGSTAQYNCICGEVWYCGRECQLEDWNSHQNFCQVVGQEGIGSGDSELNSDM